MRTFLFTPYLQSGNYPWIQQTTPRAPPTQQRHQGSPAKHPCPICGNRFRFRSRLQRHMTSHSGLRLYACAVCGSTYKLADNLYTHRKACHRDANIYQCVCSVDFALLDQLRIHMVTCGPAVSADQRTVAMEAALHTGDWKDVDEEGPGGGNS